MAVIPLLLLTAAVESVGAAAVYALVKIITDPARVGQIPVVATVATWLPWQDRAAVVSSFAALAALFYVAKNAFLIWVNTTRSRIESRSAALTSGRMFRGFLSAPYPFHFHRNSADLIRQVNSSVGMAFSVLSSTATLASELLITAGFVVVMLRAAPGSTLVAGALLATLLVVLLNVMRRRAVELGSRAHHLQMASVQSVQQGLGAIKEIKVLGRERAFADAYGKGQAELARLYYARARLDAMPRLVTESGNSAGSSTPPPRRMVTFLTST